MQAHIIPQLRGQVAVAQGEPRPTIDSAEWLLKRNCNLSPGQLGTFFVVLAFVSLAIATVWAMRGAWIVLVFAGIEVLALAVAFVAYGRHAGDFERIVIEADRLVVECSVGTRASRIEFRRHGVRTELVDDSRRSVLIKLSAGSSSIDVGGLVPEPTRRRVYAELRRELGAAW